MKDGVRSFTVVTSSVRGSNGGRYLARTPILAAKKAFSQLCKKAGLKVCANRKFTLKEITSGSSGKEYVYMASKMKLRKPIDVGQYEVKYKTIVKRHDPKKSKAENKTAFRKKVKKTKK